MRAETIAVGTELLIGQIANTNAQYLSQKLNAHGVDVYYHTVVGDNMERVLQTLETAKLRSDYVFITGGLGPTEDDLTREAVALFAKSPLIEDPDTKQTLIHYFKNRNQPMPPNNIKQATFPQSAIILKNGNGTAPGFYLKLAHCHLIVLPGPPREMQPMFENEVAPLLFAGQDSINHSKFIKIFGIGESQLEDKLKDLIHHQTSPSLATYVKEGEITLRLTAKASKSKLSDEVFEPVLREVKDRLGHLIFSLDNESLEQTAAKLLIAKKLSVSTAESCTGGLLGKKLTDISGISAVYWGGITAYQNAMKTQLLGVSAQTLEAFGAVSVETCKEMAQGIRNRSKTHLGIGITGIAGPSGGSDEKPVGLVYVGLSAENRDYIRTLRLPGNRERIRNLACLHALDMLRQYALGILTD